MEKNSSKSQNMFARIQIWDLVLITNKCLDCILKSGDHRNFYIIDAVVRSDGGRGSCNACQLFDSQYWRMVILSPLFFVIVMAALNRMLSGSIGGVFSRVFSDGDTN